MEYRRLGRSELQVSAIGFGTSQLHLTPDRQAIETLLRGFELGVNVVHTSPSYGHAEDLVARAVRASGRSIIVATTASDVPGNATEPVVRFERLFEATCERLGTERLDLFGIECIDGCEAQHENVWGTNGMVEFLSGKKAQGRLRGMFCTTHGAPEYVRRLVTGGAFDAVMLAYNLLGYHLLSFNPHYRLPPPPGHPSESLSRNRQEIFPLCREHDVGLMIMKPLAGGLLCESKAFPPRQPAARGLKNTSPGELLRAILLHPEVSCVLPGTASLAEAEDNASSGHAPVVVGRDRQDALKEIVTELRTTVCSRCGACDALCSRELPISWIFWAGLFGLYPSAASEQPSNIDYFRLHPQLESTCVACTNRTCVCPAGIDIARSLTELHSRMVELMRRGLIPPPDTSEAPVCGDSTFGARILSVDIPRPMGPGREHLCRLHLENTGERGWLSDANPCVDRHRARVALGVFVDGQRVRTLEVKRDVHPGDRWHVSFGITAPRRRSHFRLRVQLLGEHQQFSELLGPTVLSDEIRLEHASRAAGGDGRSEDSDRGRMFLELATRETERDELRGQAEVQRQQMLVVARRLRILEQLFRTIRHGRTYRHLRRLGRWRWVQHTLDRLPPAADLIGQLAPSPDGTPPTSRSRAGSLPSVEPLRDWNLNPFLHPLEAAHGYRGHLVDTAGRDFIDFSSAWGANILGYDYPRVAEAIATQARRFAGIGMPFPGFRQLERLLCQVIPGADMVRYGKNGSDVTMAAVRLARAITGRERVLHRGYHGFHDWWMASTECQGIPHALRHLIQPLPQLTPEAVDAAFAAHRGDIACVILDPMCPPMADADTVREIIHMVHRHGALMIFDEIVTGFRVAPGGMQEIWGLEPDLACYGKAVANGLPLSVLSGKHMHMRHLPSIHYGMTFEGEAVSIAAGLATVSEILEHCVCTALAAKGRFLQQEYARVAAHHGIATQLGGPAARPHLAFETQANIPERELRWLCIQELARAGVLTIGTFNLCYSHDDRDLRATVAAFERALAVVKRAVDCQSTAHLLDARVHSSLYHRGPS